MPRAPDDHMCSFAHTPFGSLYLPPSLPAFPSPVTKCVCVGEGGVGVGGSVWLWSVWRLLKLSFSVVICSFIITPPPTPQPRNEVCVCVGGGCGGGGDRGGGIGITLFALVNLAVAQTVIRDVVICSFIIPPSHPQPRNMTQCVCVCGGVGGWRGEKEERQEGRLASPCLFWSIWQLLKP